MVNLSLIKFSFSQVAVCRALSEINTCAKSYMESHGTHKININVPEQSRVRDGEKAKEDRIDCLLLKKQCQYVAKTRNNQRCDLNVSCTVVNGEKAYL